MDFPTILWSTLVPVLAVVTLYIFGSPPDLGTKLILVKEPPEVSTFVPSYGFPNN